MRHSTILFNRLIKQLYFSEMRINTINSVLNDVIKKYLKVNANDDIIHFRKKIDDYYSSLNFIKSSMLCSYSPKVRKKYSNVNLYHMVNSGNLDLETIDKNVAKLSSELQVYLINKL